MMTIRPRDWKQHSRNERSITVRGRHFFAGRCGFHWRVEEIDQADPNGSKLVQIVRTCVLTKDLSRIVAVEVMKGEAA